MQYRAKLTAGYVLFLTPALLLYFIFFLYPNLSGIYYAFTSWNGFSLTPRFVGLYNFRRMLQDTILIDSIVQTILFAVIGTIVHNVLAFALALVLDRGGKSIHYLRAVYFLPNIISVSVVAYVWSYMFSPVKGPLNLFLHALFGFSTDFPWLYKTSTALWSILGVQIWISLGFAMIIYLAGLQSISKDYYEAAKMDGAGLWAQYRDITFPLIAPAFTVNILLSLIGLLKEFTLVFLLTNGGPSNSSHLISTVIYQNLTGSHAGYSSAIGLVYAIFLCVVTLLMLPVLRRREVEL